MGWRLIHQQGCLAHSRCSILFEQISETKGPIICSLSIPREATMPTADLGHQTLSGPPCKHDQVRHLEPHLGRDSTGEAQRRG